MKAIAAQFFALSSGKRRLAVLSLCERSLAVWESHYPPGGASNYQESVTGSIQTLEVGLPREALEAIHMGSDEANVQERYREPIVALQDMDLELPDHAEFAYYAIYNAFRLYVQGLPVEEKLILNQALSALSEEEMQHALRVALEAGG